MTGPFPEETLREGLRLATVGSYVSISEWHRECGDWFANNGERLIRELLQLREAVNGGRPLTPIERIGDAHGRIALHLDKQGALDLAQMFGSGDTAYDELILAVSRAYPEDGRLLSEGEKE